MQTAAGRRSKALREPPADALCRGGSRRA